MPVPAAVWLLASALAGLGFIKRKNSDDRLARSSFDCPIPNIPPTIHLVPADLVNQSVGLALGISNGIA
ncbi:MAG: VPLPA-CTERM sorting domain-containing protein [Gammaproteobacteria bacterium]|nr:VPLPA-CTERM sorting domain-containing protein [Gammaproteobacteria bacterium]MCP4091628.1 VPLPA-CTERM sorting domain-containing protein [Gammaproteobacteria bacterium]MCP4276124.1 VPLPA-CTERM sorting domain-containing protein [Gammaproteobacteria bacterium]MCP4929694.1 VPLPA-CTERM sorting domain-containing protein [Gammaproteobacteria bacterium]